MAIKVYTASNWNWEYNDALDDVERIVKKFNKKCTSCTIINVSHSITAETEGEDRYKCSVMITYTKKEKPNYETFR